MLYLFIYLYIYIISIYLHNLSITLIYLYNLFIFDSIYLFICITYLFIYLFIYSTYFFIYHVDDDAFMFNFIGADIFCPCTVFITFGAKSPHAWLSANILILTWLRFEVQGNETKKTIED